MTCADRGNWMQTFTGKAFYPNDPQPEEIYIEDIAHALAHQCRFAGHSKRFYSVAEHSYRVAALLPRQHKLAGLLHDATEAYIVDIPRPVKALLPDYQRLEKKIATAIGIRFGVLLSPLAKQIKQADMVMLATERRDLHYPAPLPWKSIENVEPDQMPIVGLGPRDSERLFLQYYSELTGLKVGR